MPTPLPLSADERSAWLRLATARGLKPAALRALLELGCHRGQGYLLSKPKAPADLEGLLEAGGLDLATLLHDETTTQTPGFAEVA